MLQSGGAFWPMLLPCLPAHVWGHARVLSRYVAIWGVRAFWPMLLLACLRLGLRMLQFEGVRWPMLLLEALCLRLVHVAIWGVARVLGVKLLRHVFC